MLIDNNENEAPIISSLLLSHFIPINSNTKNYWILSNLNYKNILIKSLYIFISIIEILTTNYTQSNNINTERLV